MTHKLPTGVDFEIVDAGFTATTVEFFPLTVKGREFLNVEDIVSSVVYRRSYAYAKLDAASTNGIGWRIKKT